VVLDNGQNYDGDLLVGADGELFSALFLQLHVILLI